MKSRLVIPAACLVAASVKALDVPASTILQLGASKIRYDRPTHQTFLEGAASVSYGGEVVVTGEAAIRFVTERHVECGHWKKVASGSAASRP